MTSKKRLIEVAFPLEQASIDSVHEKSVRHGHISTLHIWPARRPLAASRAALIASLLDAPDNTKEINQLLARLGGGVQRTTDLKKKKNKQVSTAKVSTLGGVLRWKQETSPEIEVFRQEIRQKFGRAPRVLDPFSGGGAIPLEAMRMGCEVTAVDINPVAWFILKCTLEYPQQLAGQTLPLPDFALNNPDFMDDFNKAHKTPKKKSGKKKDTVQTNMFEQNINANLAWHVRAWGMWVLEEAKKDLARFYPIVDDKPTVAYLWARTVTCKNCRAELPLLKTRWLAKKDNKRVLLTMQPNPQRTGVIFDIDPNAPDDADGTGTMSKSGAKCPCCDLIMTQENIRFEGMNGRLGQRMTAVVVKGKDTKSKEYRLPTDEEIQMAREAENYLEEIFDDIPFGLPIEPTPRGGSGASRAFSIDGYGFDQWYKIFTSRQLLAFGVLIKHTRRLQEMFKNAPEWSIPIISYLAMAIDKLADYNASLTIWHKSGEKMGHVFTRFALPITWDFAEVNPLSKTSGNYEACVNWIFEVVEHLLHAVAQSSKTQVINQSAIQLSGLSDLDLVLTDPPYYDAIPYSDLMDFFYIWLRRTVYGLSPELDQVFVNPLSPKWNHESDDGELIDDASRFDNNKQASKQNYEDGMAKVFQNCHQMLNEDGRMVVVFANKQADAWETLVSAIIRAGFVVTGSWPIQTEMSNRMRANNSAALSSSIWLVCKKRPSKASAGWDNRVLDDMRVSIQEKLNTFWDAGIRGPDFIWAATGPALESYSKHPIVKKANEANAIMNVAEFLNEVRRLVVEFVVGRVLNRGEDGIGLDMVTVYYILHRKDYGMENAPINACILYAMSCNLTDSELTNQYNILTAGKKTKSTPVIEDEDEEAEFEEDDESGEKSGSEVRLVAWNKRDRKSMGYASAGGRPVPMIDQLHRLMFLWRAGDIRLVDEYLEGNGLRQNQIFSQLIQAIIELAPNPSDERALMESISNHLHSRDTRTNPRLL